MSFAGGARDAELLAVASEAWNHTFYWQSLTPRKKRPGGELGRAIDRAFGDFTSFAHEFALAGAAQAGSGWLWLVANHSKQVEIRDRKLRCKPSASRRGASGMRDR